ncbi:MAG: YqgE/AlgH family protein [Solirubrobacteraceae bacterium]
MDSLRGKLLIASPALIDPNFRRTVVLIGPHDEQGALGLVLNRPSEVLVSDVVEHLEPLTAPDELLYVGGPVAPSAVVVLAQFCDPELAALMIVGDVGLPTMTADPQQLAAGVSHSRCFAGHAGWGPGQLDDEIEEESWIVEALTPDDLWLPPSRDLWATLLERKGGEYALIARMPMDPSLN